MLTTSKESTGYEKIRKSRMQLYNFCFNGDHKYLSYIFLFLCHNCCIVSRVCETITIRSA